MDQFPGVSNTSSLTQGTLYQMFPLDTGKEEIHSFVQQRLVRQNGHESKQTNTLFFVELMSNWGRYHKQEICLTSNGNSCCEEERMRVKKGKVMVTGDCPSI